MSWDTPGTLRKTLLARWRKGTYYAPGADSRFPLEVRLKGPTAGEMSARFDETRM